LIGRGTWLAFAGCLLLCRAASADQRFVRLAWARADGGEACLSQSELGERVRARLGRDPFSEQGALSIEGWVRREGTRLRATLRVQGDAGHTGERELDSEELDCAALGDAVVLAVALAIDPDAALRPPERAAAVDDASGPLPPPPEPIGAPVAAPPPAPQPVPVAFSDAPIERGVGGDLRVRGALHAGTLPALAWGVALAGHVRFDQRLAAMLALVYLPEVRTDSGRAAFGLTAGQLGGCVQPVSFRAGGLDACAGVEAGAIHAVSFGERPLEPGDKPWLAGFGLVQVWGVVSEPWLVELGVGAGVPVLRHEFVVRGEPGRVFSPSSVVAQGFFGLGASF
jgi:hypothetical protein